MPLPQLACVDFDAALARHPMLLVDVFGPGCPACTLVEPAVEQAARTFAGRIEVLALDAAECPEIADQLGVTSIPTLVLFRAGEELERRVGALSRPALVAWLEGAIAGP